MCFKHINIYEHQFWNAIDNDNEIMRRDIAMSNKLSNYKLFTLHYTSASEISSQMTLDMFCDFNKHKLCECSANNRHTIKT